MRKLPTYITLMSVLLSTASVTAYSAVQPESRGQLIRDFARLTFEWPEPTLFTADASGNSVVLTFDRKTDPDIKKILQEMHPYIMKAERKGDGRTIKLTFNKPYRIRTFISDNISGIDILGVDANRKTVAVKAMSPAALKKQQQEKQAKASFAPPTTPEEEAYYAQLEQLEPAAGETDQPAAQAEAQPEPQPEQAAPETDAAPALKTKTPEELAAELEAAIKNNVQGEVSTLAAPEQDNTESPAPQVVAPPVPQVTTEPELKPKEKAKEEELIPDRAVGYEPPPEGSGSYTQDIGVSMVPLDLTAPEEEAEAEAEAGLVEDPEKPEPGGPVELSESGDEAFDLNSNKLVVSSDESAATVRVPLHERAALAVFIRGNSLWLVIDKKIDIDMSDFKDLPSGVVESGEILPHEKATVIHIGIVDNIHADIKQQEGHTEVAVILSSQKAEQSSPLDVTINTEPPAPAHVFLPVLEPGKVIHMTDPTIGDKLIVTPVYVLEQGIAEERNFIEFSLLQSMQGVVVAKKADATEVVVLRNGLRVSMPNGASLSTFTDDLKARYSDVVYSSADTLFPYEEWRLPRNHSLKATMDRLIHTSVFGANEGEKNLARLRMAQLFLSDGYAAEALGMLDVIRRSNKAYYRSAKLASLRGAANVLMYRFNDAARDFSAAELNDNPEMEFWRNMLADLLGSPDKTSDYLAMDELYISKYPPSFRQRLAIVAADRAIATKKHNIALKIFDGLDEDGIIEPIQSYVDFLKAKIAADNGQEKQALEVWERLANSNKDPFVKARAEFSKILWQLDNNVVPREKIIDLLERLRLGWHGDGLELQIVQLLGDMYSERKDYVNAMRVWQIGVTGFRNTGPAVEMNRKMQDTFVKLFNEGIADQMTPIQALALYYQYRNFTPSGQEGLQMIEKLADRLVGVDLLSSAAQLLEQQMRSQLEKVERSRVGAKLASIYLMNNQPKRAMQALQQSVYGENPILMRIHRNQIAAEVMMELGRPNEALATLGGDDSVPAEKIRAMIYWSDKNWPKLITSIENIFKKRPDPSAQLSVEESEYLLRLALGYVFQEDWPQLQYMRDYFIPLLHDNPNLQTVDFITRPDIQPNTRNFDELLQALSETRKFISNYEAQIVMADAEPAGGEGNEAPPPSVNN